MRIAVCLAVSALLIAGIYASPLELFSKVYLLSAFVVKHLLLNLAVPLLLVRGLPLSIARRVRVPAPIAWVAAAVSLAIWYVPSLYNAGLRDPRVEAVQAISWVLGGILLFLPLFKPAVANRLKPVPPAIIYLFAMAVVASVLGLRLATLPPGLYGSFLAPRDPLHILDDLQNFWHFDPQTDQQTAGLLLWISSCGVFLSSVMLMFYRMYKSER